MLGAPRSLEAVEVPALVLSVLNTQQMVPWGVNTGRREVVSSQMQCPVSCSEQPEGCGAVVTLCKDGGLPRRRCSLTTCLALPASLVFPSVPFSSSLQ